MDFSVSQKIIDGIGVSAGLLTTASFVPQLIRTWKLRSARDLSYGWLTCFTAGLASWLTYGILIHSAPVIIANTCTITLVGGIWAMKLKYG